ncbi:MAG: hypothetical protein AAFX93_18600 [Verrucomicrobiota bacterium]
MKNQIVSILILAAVTLPAVHADMALLASDPTYNVVSSEVAATEPIFGVDYIIVRESDFFVVEYKIDPSASEFKYSSILSEPTRDLISSRINQYSQTYGNNWRDWPRWAYIHAAALIHVYQHNSA